MNDVIKLILELQEMANHGNDIDEAKLDLAMQLLKKSHDNNIDNNIFLSNDQKGRRKALYDDCIRTMKKYAKQSLLDEKEIRENLLCQIKK